MELKYIDAEEAQGITTIRNEEEHIKVMNPIFDQIREAANSGFFFITLFATQLQANYQEELTKRGYMVAITDDGPNEYKTVISWEVNEEPAVTIKTTLQKVAPALQIEVSCERNDSTDIKAGGPPVLGYDFYVSKEEYSEEPKLKRLTDSIEASCRKHRRGFIGINISTVQGLNISNFWTLERMERCIKENVI